MLQNLTEYSLSTALTNVNVNIVHKQY